MESKINEYDVVVVGMGISGLICSCYLVKNGLKVLLIEQHTKPGGYCSSFTRGEFLFDIGIHYFGGFKSTGIFRKILDELGLLGFIHRKDPSDVIFLPDHEIVIWNDVQRTQEGFIKNFPHEESSIRTFFEIIINLEIFEVYRRFRHQTFNDFLNCYFSDEKLKAVFSVVLGNLGLPSTAISAISAIVLYREFILDSGFCPVKSHQSFSNMLLKTFTSSGGTALLGERVVSVNVSSGRVNGVATDKQRVFDLKFLVAATDFLKTVDLINDGNIRNELSQKARSVVPSPSLFIVYLGLNLGGDVYKNGLFKHNGIWFFPSYKVDRYYESVLNNKIDFENMGFFATTKIYKKKNGNNLATINILTTAPYKDINYWKENKLLMQENIVEKFFSRFGLENLKYVVHKESASPLTLEKFTLNSFGAAYGSANILSQIDQSVVSQKVNNLENLYFAGHWLTQEVGQGGVSMAAHSGYKAATRILKQVMK